MDEFKKLPCLILWIALCVLYSYWAWTSQLNDFGGDSAVYLLTAQHWSFFGDTNASTAQFASASNFPPLYPLLLALFSAGQDWFLAHQITAFCGVASLFILWRWLRAANTPLADSLVLVGLIALVPGFYLQALYLHSEFLFLLFVSACIYFVSRFESRPTFFLLAMASVAAAGAYLTRSIGLALVVALVAYVLLHCAKREWFIVLLFAVAPVCIWAQFGARSGGYLTSWTERFEITGAPSIADHLTMQLVALIDGAHQNLAGPSSTNTLVVLIFFLCCFLAWAYRLRHGKLDALFLGAYFAILLAWPFPAERVRLVLPAVPIVVVQFVLALYSWKPARFSKGPIIAVRLAMAVLAIIILPNLVLTVSRNFEPIPNELTGYRQSPEWYGANNREARIETIVLYKRVQAGLEELQTKVASGQCIYSIKAPLVGLFAQRISYRLPLPKSDLGKLLDSKVVQCHYVHMLPFASPTFTEPFYPLMSWANGMDIVHVTRLVESDENSAVVGILGKLR